MTDGPIQRINICSLHAPKGIPPVADEDRLPTCVVCGLGGLGHAVKRYELPVTVVARGWPAVNRRIARPGWGEPDQPTAADHVQAISAATRDVTAAVARQRAVVEAARDAGVSWTEIGRALGVTRQSARQRFRQP